MKHRKTRKTRWAERSGRPNSSSTLVRSPRSFRSVELSLEPVAPSSWPPISVCMIVKNESGNLRPCLESLGDLASEIIIVDTGSSDDTVQIAQATGCSVHHFPWVNDFSAARNESVRHATGEWVFWLDADDRLSPQAVAQLKRAAALARADAYSCLVSSTEPDGRQNSAEHIRLFRNGLGIRFEGAVHETVSADLVRLGLALARTDIVVRHTGYESAEAVRQKNLRNLPALDAQLALDPNDLQLYFYRGQARANLGDWSGAESDLRTYLAGTRPATGFDYMRFLCYSVLVSLLERRCDTSSMDEVLDRALLEFTDHPHFLLIRSRRCLLQGNAADALKGFLLVYQSIQRPVRGTRPRDAWVEVSLAEAYRALGQKADALRWAEQARDHAPDWEPAATLLAHLSAEVEPRQQGMGLHYLRQQEHLQAAQWFAEAIESNPTDPTNYRYLAAALKELGREQEALEAWQLANHWASQTQPEGGKAN